MPNDDIIIITPRPKLIPQWKQAWKLTSVQLTAVLGLLATAYEYLPQIQTVLDGTHVKWAALAIIIARILDQHRSSPKAE